MPEINITTFLLLSIIPHVTSFCGALKCTVHPMNDVEEGNIADLPVVLDKARKNVITVQGSYDVSKIVPKSIGSRGSLDTVDFAIIDDVSDVIAIPVQIALQFGRHTKPPRNAIRLMGFRKASQTEVWDGDENGWIMNPKLEHEMMFNSTQNSFTIQISDLHVATNNAYTIVFDSPGSPVFQIYFNYFSKSVWNQYKLNYPLSAVNMISVNKRKSYGFNRMVKIDFISICHDPIPELSEPTSQMIHADLHRSYTLECSASGAPYLSSKWTGPVRGMTYKHTEEFSDDYSKILSSLIVYLSSIQNIGTYNCTIFNRNFGYSVDKPYYIRYSHPISVYQSPSVPLETYSSEKRYSVFTWILEGWPLTEVDLRCQDQSGYIIPIDRHLYSEDHSPPSIELTLIIDSMTASDVINCSVANGTTVLEKRSITREGYNCSEGQIPRAKECIDHFQKDNSTTIKYTVAPILMFLVGVVFGMLLLLWLIRYRCFGNHLNSILKWPRQYDMENSESGANEYSPLTQPETDANPSTICHRCAFNSNDAGFEDAANECFPLDTFTMLANIHKLVKTNKYNYDEKEALMDGFVPGRGNVNLGFTFGVIYGDDGDSLNLSSPQAVGNQDAVPGPQPQAVVNQDALPMAIVDQNVATEDDAGFQDASSEGFSLSLDILTLLAIHKLVNTNAYKYDENEALMDGFVPGRGNVNLQFNFGVIYGDD